MITVGYSALTDRIYVGRVKDNEWIGEKQDVTDKAVLCVAEYLLTTKQKLVFEYENNKYEMVIRKIEKEEDKK